MNGVSKPTLIPLNFDNVIPGCLHVAGLGFVADEAQSICKELKLLDAADPAAVEAHEAAVDELEEAEISLLSNVDGCVGLLVSDHAVIQKLVSEDTGILVAQTIHGVTLRSYF